MTSILSGCSSDSADSSSSLAPEAVENSQQVAVSSINDAVNTSLEMINTILDNDAFQGLDSNIANNFTSISPQSAFSQLLSSQSEKNTQSKAQNLDNLDFNEILDTYFLEPISENGSLQYTMDTEKSCETDVDVELTDEELAVCKDLFDGVFLELTPSTAAPETEGEITLSYDANEFLVFTYAPNTTKLEVRFDEIVDALESIASLLDESFETGEVISGSIEIGLSKDNDQNTLSFSVLDTLNLQAFDSFSESSTRLVIEKAIDALVISAENSENQASVQWGFNAINFESSIGDIENSEFLDEEFLEGSWSFSAIKGLLQLDNEEETVTISDFSLGEEGLQVSQDNIQSSFVISPLDLTIFNATETLVTTNDATILQTLQAAALEGLNGTLETQIPADTELNLGYVDAIEVLSGGPVVFTGTEDLAGQLSVSVGECFDADLLFPLSASATSFTALECGIQRD